VTYAVALPDRPLLDQLDDDPGPLRIGYTVRCALCEPHPEAVGAVEHAAQLHTELGHHVEEVDPPHDDRQLGRDVLVIWFVHQALEVDRIQRETGAGDEGFEPDTRLMAALGRTFRAVELQSADERRREHITVVSTWAKSIARIAWACAVKNWRQLGPDRCGAGSMPAAGVPQLRRGESPLMCRSG
jgi:amidase